MSYHFPVFRSKCKPNKEILRERYVSPEERQKIMNDLRLI